MSEHIPPSASDELTPKQLAARWHIALKTVYNKVERGEPLPTYTRRLDRLFFRIEDVMAFERENFKIVYSSQSRNGNR